MVLDYPWRVYLNEIRKLEDLLRAVVPTLKQWDEVRQEDNEHREKQAGPSPTFDAKKTSEFKYLKFRGN